MADHKQQKMTKGSKRGLSCSPKEHFENDLHNEERPMSSVVVVTSPCTTEVDQRQQDHDDHKALQLESKEIQNEEERQW